MLLGVILAMGMTVPAIADTGVKNAVLQDTRIRFNDGAVQTVQCYNIDGFNFIRARDITNGLGMEVEQAKNGVMIHPFNLPISTRTLEHLTKNKTKVKVEQGEISYDIYASPAECFLLDGRYYFKLADFKKSADYAIEETKDMVVFIARAGIIKEPPEYTLYSGITVEWNPQTKIVDISKTEHDFRPLFYDNKNEEAVEEQEQQSSENNKKVMKEEIEYVEGDGYADYYEYVRYLKQQEEKKNVTKEETLSNIEAEPVKKEESQAAQEHEAVDSSQFAEKVVYLVNMEREKVGIAPLKMDNTLQKVADIRAEEIKTNYSHTRPNGESWRTVLDEYECKSSYTGENIYWGYDSINTPEKVVKGWMNSEGHRKNILNPNYHYIGVGYKTEINNENNWGNKNYWVQNFSS